MAMGWPEGKAVVGEWQRLIESEWPGLEIERLREPGLLTGDEIAAFRAIADGSLHFFNIFVLGYHRLGGVGSFHWDFCERLEHIDKPQLHLYYRKGFKTTIAGIGLPLWRAAKDPENFSFLKLVADRPLGEQQLAAVRYQIDRNPALRVLYPWMRPNPKDWSAEKASLACRDFANTGSTFEFLTLFQGSAGRHVSLIQPDDLVNEKNWESRNEQDRMKERLKLMWPTLDLETDGVVFTGTRYADYDVWGFCIETWYPLDLDVFVQPVRGRGWIGEDGRTVVEDTGEYAHPDEWDDERYETEMRRMADGYLARCQYMLDTSHRGGRGFDEAWFRYVAEDDDLPSMTIYMAADPASGKGTSQPALAVAGIDAEGYYYPLWSCADYGSEAEFLDGLFGAYRLWKPVYVGLESYGQGGLSMQQQIAARSKGNGVWLPLEIMTHGHSEKDVHIRQSMRPQYETRRVRHPERLRGGDYEAQLLAFPGGSFDDLIDAMAYAFRLCTTYGYLGERAVKGEEQPRITYPAVPRGGTLEELCDPKRRVWAEVEEQQRVGSVW